MRTATVLATALPVVLAWACLPSSAGASSSVACKRNAPLPTWGFLAKPDGQTKAKLKPCARAEGSRLIVEMKNKQPYGVVLRYGTPVAFGWSEKGFGLPSLFRSLGMSGLQDGLYIPPKSRASVGLNPGIGGPVTFTARPESLAVALDYMLDAFDLRGGAAADALAKSPGCANVARTLFVANDLITSGEQARNVITSMAGDLIRCTLEVDIAPVRQLVTGKWRRAAKKLAKRINKVGEAVVVLEMAKRAYAQFRGGPPAYFTILPALP